MLNTLLAYKRWANDELLTLGLTSAHALPADDCRLFIRILNHTYVVDQIFMAHMKGMPHGFSSTNTEATPELGELRTWVAASDEALCDYVAALPAAALEEAIHFRFTDGDAGCMTRHEMVQHLMAHGAYHRGAAGRILAVHGVQPPPDSLTAFLHRTQPQRRGGEDSPRRSAAD